MFAVPGWSVSAGSLKVESEAGSKSAGSGMKARKRKRGPKEDEVNASNISELWQSVIEGKSPAEKKKRKKSVNQEEAPTKIEKSSKVDPTAESQDEKKKQKQKSKQKKKKARQQEGEDRVVSLDKPKKGNKKKDHDENHEGTPDARGDGDDQTPPASLDDASKSKFSPKASSKILIKQDPLQPATTKLTPLQAAMREKLISARFRHLNETLYTRPSAQAFQLFEDSPDMFDEYHEGFRRQVKVWPENPVDSFLRDIRTRGKVRAPGRHQKQGHKSNSSAVPPLPRTAGTAILADLGCGDARLAASLQSAGDTSKMRIEVKSYDLQGPSHLVTKADVANLPLEDGSVNVAIFCLALMGTNWIDFIEEAYRILHWKGELWIAEIKSRFGPVKSKNAPVTHSVGNRKKALKQGKGKEDKADNGDDLAVEVDGAEDYRRETDVSAFVEVLKQRGFVLQGEKGDAVDISNKMFVKMHFIKGAAPTKGKGVKELEQQKKSKREKIPWPDGKDDDNSSDVNEASILKPCVYKIR